MRKPIVTWGAMLAGTCLLLAAALAQEPMDRIDRNDDRNFHLGCELPEGYTQQELERCKMRRRQQGQEQGVPAEPLPETDAR